MKNLVAWIFWIFILALSGCNMTDKSNDIILPSSTDIAEDEEYHYPLYTEEIFDFAVSYANYAYYGEIIGELNTDKMLISSVRHLPIWKFNTLEELEQFKQLNDKFNFDSSYDDISSFNDTVVKYDEAFFEKNSLMLIYVSANSGAYRYSVNSVYCNDTSFCVHVEQTNHPESVIYDMTDMTGWFITVAVPDGMVENCTEFDADLDNIEN